MSELNNSQSVAILNNAVSLLAQVRTVQDAEKIMSIAEAARVYAQQEKLGMDAQNYATEIRIRAQRLAGQILKANEKSQGGRPRKDEEGVPAQVLEDNSEPLEKTPSTPARGFKKPPTYSELGIDYKDAHRWQVIAEIPEDDFEKHIEEGRKKGRLTSSGIYREAQRAKQRSLTVEPQPFPTNIYRTIIIDPPWKVEKIIREERPMQIHWDYPSMTVEEIADLPVDDLANPGGCHVYLWTTHKYLPDCFEIFEAWGVKYQCLLTWVKNVGNTPFSWMYSTELVLFGRVGSLDLLVKGKRLDFTGKVREHSRKPDEFYELVKTVSPENRLEMFAREKRNGFDSWGNEREKFQNRQAN